MKNIGLVALALIQLVDSISYMVVAPSIVFYVLQVGGTMDEYGLILSTFSFASFVGKPVLGLWLDARGNKFRVPYIVSISLSCVGGIVYFFANSFASSSPTIAVGMIFLGRLLNGFGAANQALGFAYLASVVSPDQMTQTSSVLSLTRIIGMASGPGFNVLLAKVALSIPLFGTTFELDPLNSVGLFLAACNIIALLVVWAFLEEPPTKKPSVSSDDPTSASIRDQQHGLVESLCCIEILLPVFTIFVINSSFQLIETGFTPAANHALGWGPIESSGVLGSTSIVIFACMAIVFTLSRMKVPDEGLIAIGACFWIVGGTSMYFLWVQPGVAWHFVLTVVVAVAGFPFMAPSNRSIFTKAVDSIPQLESKHGTMQALLSSVASAAGFMTPGFVASFVLRTPEEVEASSDHRELNPIALYCPVFTALILVGLAYQQIKLQQKAQEESEREGMIGEGTPLIKRDGRFYSAAGMKQRERLSTEIHRRSSVTIMGIPAGETYQERVERKSVADISTKILEEDADLSNLDF